jgi:hypothetical protein
MLEMVYMKIMNKNYLKVTRMILCGFRDYGRRMKNCGHPDSVFMVIDCAAERELPEFPAEKRAGLGGYQHCPGFHLNLLHNAATVLQKAC